MLQFGKMFTDGYSALNMWRFRVSRFFFKIIQVILTRLVVEGRENIPAQSPYILVTNHMSTADTVLVFVGFPAQKWRFFAGEKWHQHPLWGPLMSWLGVIFINRGEIDRRALREALAILADGTVFALAPEGTRSKTGAMMAAKDGAAFLASHARYNSRAVPILPVGLNNTDMLFAQTRRLRRATITMRVGSSFTLPDLGHRPRGRDLSAYTHLIMIQIAALVDPRHRGIYAHSPALQAYLAGEDPWPHCLAAAGQVS
jgi:1-acyl-sn-glycerol-3-phosphate acyltransferase